MALLDVLTTDAEANGPTPAQAWLSRKGQQHGSEVMWATSDGFWHGASSRGNSSAKKSVPIYGVRFDGVLRVTNGHLLAEALQIGIGPAKAFGFGLLARHKQ